MNKDYWRYEVTWARECGAESNGVSVEVVDVSKDNSYTARCSLTTRSAGSNTWARWNDWRLHLARYEWLAARQLAATGDERVRVDASDKFASLTFHRTRNSTGPQRLWDTLVIPAVTHERDDMVLWSWRLQTTRDIEKVSPDGRILCDSRCNTFARW